jgi:hypothetical protein
MPPALAHCAPGYSIVSAIAPLLLAIALIAPLLKQTLSASENRLVTRLTHPSISLHCPGLSQHNHHLRLTNGLAIDSHYPLGKSDTISSGENLVIDFDLKSWLSRLWFCLCS